MYSINVDIAQDFLILSKFVQFINELIAVNSHTAVLFAIKSFNELTIVKYISTIPTQEAQISKKNNNAQSVISL